MCFPIYSKKLENGNNINIVIIKEIEKSKISEKPLFILLEFSSIFNNLSMIFILFKMDTIIIYKMNPVITI